MTWACVGRGAERYGVRVSAIFDGLRLPVPTCPRLWPGLVAWPAACLVYRPALPRTALESFRSSLLGAATATTAAPHCHKATARRVKFLSSPLASIHV